MITPADYALWLGTALVAGYVVVLSQSIGVWRCFPILNTYLALIVCTDLYSWLVSRRSGFSSREYRYFYYCSDLLLSIALYIAIAELYRRVLPVRQDRWHRWWFVALLVLVAVFSGAMAWHFAGDSMGLFAIELSRSLFFVSAGLALVLWVVAAVHRLPRGIAVRMVQVWGIYFVLVAGSYYLGQLSPLSWDIHSEVALMTGAWLPIGLGFAIVNGVELGV